MSCISFAKTKFLILAAALCMSSAAFAATLSTEAFDNATVRPGGPRSGSSGKAFFNIEGSTNGAFASYGVADFNFGSPGTILDINSATLELTQDNASFSLDGSVIVSLDTTASLVDIQSGTSPLAYDGADPGTATDETDGDLTLVGLGTANYVVGATGDVDSYSLTLSSAAKSELLSRLNSGSDIRLVFGTGEATVAATWSGFSNNDRVGPTLILDVEVPEPATALMLVLGLVPWTLRRKA